MKYHAMAMRIALVGLAALLTALPIAESASPVEAKKRSRTVTRTFANTAAIGIPVGGSVGIPVSASPYPSSVVVRGLKQGTIRDVDLTLKSFGHTFPDDVEVLLVGPGGQTAIVLANVGEGEAVSGMTLRLDDEAAAALPDTTVLRSGTFRPTNAESKAITFNDPAPSTTTNAALAVFDGTDPNGLWRLFVQDEKGPTGAGAFAGGGEVAAPAKVKTKTTRR